MPYPPPDTFSLQKAVPSLLTQGSAFESQASVFIPFSPQVSACVCVWACVFSH